MSFQAFAWLATILYGFDTLTAKFISKYSIPNPWHFNFIWNFFIVIFSIPIALYNGAGMPTEWINVFFAAVFYALGNIFFILTLYRLDVSVITPFNSIRTAFGALLGALFLQEILSGFQYGLIAVIFVSGFFVSLDEKLSAKSFFNKNIVLAFLLMLFLALEGMFVKKAAADIGYWSTILWIGVISITLLLFTIPLFKKDLVIISTKQYGLTFFMSMLELLATLAAYKAYAGNASISGAIISVPVSMILVFIVSFFAPTLFEKHTLKIYAVRFIAAAVMIIAALKL